MSDVTSPVQGVAVPATGPSFTAALCGFVSSMVAATALLLLIAAL